MRNRTKESHVGAAKQNTRKSSKIYNNPYQGLKPFEVYEGSLNGKDADYHAIVILNRGGNGMHCTPTARFVKKAQEYDCEVFIHYLRRDIDGKIEEKYVNGKSTIYMLTLGITEGSSFCILTKENGNRMGNDAKCSEAKKCIEALVEFVKELNNKKEFNKDGLSLETRL